MARRPGERWSGFLARVADAYGMVLLLVIGTYAVMSWVTYEGWGGVAIACIAGTCACVGLASAGARDRVVVIAAITAAVAVLLAIVGAISGSPTASGIAALIEVALLLEAAAVMLGTVVSEREVGFRTILGAISVYILLGLLFVFVYSALDKLQSGLFFGQKTGTGDYVFFSITTLTTTGYGNLVPAAQPGKFLAGLEMLMGQIFLVTLIAGLVSLWRPGGIGRRNGSDTGES
jgi:hypothetical protein